MTHWIGHIRIKRAFYFFIFIKFQVVLEIFLLVGGTFGEIFNFEIKWIFLL